MLKGRVLQMAALAVVAASVAAMVAGCGSSSEATGAGSDWSTNGGTMSNERYSMLDDIDTSNVSQLKGVWRTHLNGSGVAAKYSGESQPIVQDGVIYITTGNDDVFAVSVDSGKILWEHKSNISQEISTICCGWLNRGVAIGDGRLYIGQLDGKVVGARATTSTRPRSSRPTRTAGRSSGTSRRSTTTSGTTTAEPGRPVRRREERRDDQGNRRPGQDRLALPARSRVREAALRDR